MKKRISKRTIALLAAAFVLLASGGVMGTRAQLSIYSDPYNAEFALDHIGIQISENSKTVTDGILKDVKLSPGKEVTDTITVTNTTEIPQFVRLVVKKYWADPVTTDENGSQSGGDKNVALDPSLIELTGISSDWVLNEAESTTERSVYYCTTALASNASSKVYDGFKVKSAVMTKANSKGELLYDGCSVCIEVEAQSVQTHNATDAIRSVWGVTNISADESTLKLTVN